MVSRCVRQAYLPWRPLLGVGFGCWQWHPVLTGTPCSWPAQCGGSHTSTRAWKYSRYLSVLLFFKTNICRKYSRCLTARLSIKHRQLQEIIFESARYLHRRLIPWILIIQFNPDWALLLELVVGEFEAVILDHPSKLMPLNFTISVVIKQLQRFDHSLKVLTYL